VINPPAGPAEAEQAEKQTATEAAAEKLEEVKKPKKRRWGRKRAEEREVWVDDKKEEAEHHGYARMATKWVTIRVFATTAEVSCAYSNRHATSGMCH
jgi:hypothetical protein